MFRFFPLFRPTPTSKILLYSSLGFFPIVFVTCLKFTSNYNEWSESSPIFRSTVILKASEQLGRSLEGYYVFGKIAVTFKVF